jgi:hypothetical protein
MNPSGERRSPRSNAFVQQRLVHMSRSLSDRLSIDKCFLTARIAKRAGKQMKPMSSASWSATAHC